MKQAIRSPHAPSGTGPYTPALVAGDYVFVSGQAALDAQTHELRGGRRARERVPVSIDLYEEYNAVYEEVFRDEPRPTRTTVGAALGPGLLVEIDCIAYLPRD